MSLYTKHRPKTLDEVLGNRSTVDSLQALFTRPRSEIPHTFLITGNSGCGKTTLARIMARELGASEEDIREVDTADYRGIDGIREIRQQMRLRPLSGEMRAWILDECHQLSKDAMSALLKALEDTPAHVIFILCTTDPQKLLPTIRNRCATFTVQPLSEGEIEKLLQKTARAERKRIPSEVTDLIKRDCLGSARAALVMLDKVIALPSEQQLAAVEQAAVQEGQAIELCRALLKPASWKAVASILKSIQEQDAESIRRMVLGYMQSVLLGGQTNNQAALVMEAFRADTYNIGWPGITLACYSIIEGS